MGKTREEDTRMFLVNQAMVNVPIGTAGLIVVLMMVVQKISDLFELVKTLFGL